MVFLSHTVRILWRVIAELVFQSEFLRFIFIIPRALFGRSLFPSWRNRFPFDSNVSLEQQYCLPSALKCLSTVMRQWKSGTKVYPAHLVGCFPLYLLFQQRNTIFFPNVQVIFAYVCCFVFSIKSHNSTLLLFQKSKKSLPLFRLSFQKVLCYRHPTSRTFSTDAL